MLRVRFSQKENNIFTDKSIVTHYSHIEQYQGICLFFPNKYKYVVVDEKESADICVIGVQHQNNDLLRDNELNVLITVENLSVGRFHYSHLNKFNRYGNNKVDLYYYNDATQLTDNTIPIHYCFIKQYKYLEHIYEPILQNNIDDKRFCLAISKNNLNSNKNKILTLMSQLGRVDHISQYDSILSKKSCYNSPEILKVFNRYKFIICVENSKTNGYITEKIFNIFLAKSIPIYDGAPDIETYINEEAFIKYDKTFIKKVIYAANNKEIYNRMINAPKFNETNVDIQQFEKKMENVFDNHIDKKNIVPK